MLNIVVMMGRLVTDPIYSDMQRTDERMLPVVRYRIAVERDYKKEGKRPVDFVSCKAYDSAAEFAKEYLRQGDTIIVSGKLYTYSYKKAGEEQGHIYSMIHVLQNYLVKKPSDAVRIRIASPTQDKTVFEQEEYILNMPERLLEQMPPLPPFFDDDEPYEAIYADYHKPQI